MHVGIDELFDMLSWNSDEETQRKGIELAQDVKCISVFLQPHGLEHSKDVWENCAKVLIAKTDDELLPYIGKLFVWFQDMCWPGANLIYDRLLMIPWEKIEMPLKISIKLANKNQDKPWLTALNAFRDTKLIE